MSHSRIPVVMYHSVGRAHPDWLWGHLTTPFELFEKQVQVLKRNGYRSISLDQYRDDRDGIAPLEGRSVVLTFDDGYLDNWVAAYPLLKREGWQGTIYVNPDFIDPGDNPRPTLEDVWAGRCRMDDLQWQGFLNRAELKLLQDSGTMVIGSHSMTHTWYAKGPDVVDTHRPDRSTPWLAWNARPERKFAYLTEDQSDFVPFGTPIHEHGRSLGIRRFFPEDEGGRYETDDEMMARYRHEIFESRRILQELTDSEVRHFCWPGGAYCDESWPLAEEAGYATICVTSRDKNRWFSEDPGLVRRIGCSDLITLKGRKFPTDDPNLLFLACEMELGNSWKKWPLRFRKLATAAKAGFSPLKG